MSHDIETLEKTDHFDFAKVADMENTFLPDCTYLDLNVCDCTQSTQSSITVGHLNIHSLPDKYNSLIELLDDMDKKGLLPDILLLCETFLSGKNVDRYTFSQYDLINEYRKKKSKGGVSIMIKKCIRYYCREDLCLFEEGKFESVFVEIGQNHKPNIVLGEVYRVPGTNELDFLENYENLIAKIRNERKKIIIGTDQNLDYLKLNIHANTMKFYDLNLSNNLLPTILKPTRVTHTSATLIDNIYIDAALIHNVVKSHVVITDISDHFLCVVLLENCGNLKTESEKFMSRKVDDTTLRNMKGTLRNKDWSFLEDLTVNEVCRSLNTEIYNVLDFYAPQKMITTRNTYKERTPWYTKGLRTSSAKCKKMFRKVVHKSHDNAEYIAYKEYKNIFKKLLRKAKLYYYNDLLSKSKNDSRKLWATLNKITGRIRNKNDITDEILLNGVKETNKSTISNAFAKYYSEIGKNLANDLTKNGNTVDPILNMTCRVANNCFLFPTTYIEIENFIRKLEQKDSRGYDDISNKILKAIYPSIMYPMWILFNKSLGEGEFPENMKLAIVKPLYKAKSKHEISNYRPISLLPVISKILEKIVNCRITKFLCKHKVLYEGQYGFRKFRSTTDAILDLTGNILEGFNKGMYTLALFLDMSKAFDSINHVTLLQKLEIYGIRGTTLSWIKSYLTGRTIQVKYRNTLSNSYQVEFGTPQGSVLGPLLYIIMSNDLQKCLKFCRSISFADDTTVFVSGRNLKFLYRKINEDVKNLNMWFKSNSLSLNVDKSNYVIFKTKTKNVNDVSKIQIGGREVKRVANVKFLGVYMDEHLEWSVHVKYLLSKLTAGIYSLNMAKNIVNYSSKRLIYLAHVQSHLDYALSIWGPMISVKNRNKLRVQQNKSIRAIFNANKRTKLLPLYKKGNLLTIEDLTELSLIKISYRYVNDMLPARIINLFEIQPHTQVTRNRNLLQTPFHTLNIYNRSFLGRAPHLWLHLPQQLKESVGNKVFGRNYTKYKLLNY